jgi:hypothetical protein
MENYIFSIPHGNQIMQFTTSTGDVKECPCGCDTYNLVFKVIHATNPSGVIGSPPLWLKVEIFKCTNCGYELTLNHLTKTQAAEQREGANDGQDSNP